LGSGRESSGVPGRLEDVGQTLRELQQSIEEEEPLEAVLDRLAQTARRTIPDATVAGITVVAEDETRTTVATDDIIVEIDRVQYAAGDGPCLEAARSRLPVRVRVAEAHERWPAFARAAQDAGMLAFLSAPLTIGEEPVLGAVDMYSRDEDAFDSLDESLLNMFTSAASAAIVNAARYRRVRELAEDMAAALTSRAQIDQAKGVLMARHGVDEEAAFQLLVHESQRTNVKVREVARTLLRSLREQDGR
jgi:GAF domain-containing protein